MDFSKQKLAARFYAFSLLLLLAVFAADAVAKGVLYRVQPENGKASYLIGTMHSADPRVLKVMADVEPVMLASQRLVLEMVPDAAAMIAASVQMIYTDGSTLRGAIGDELYSQVVLVGKGKGLDEATLKRLKPWAVAVALSLPSSGGEMMDMALYTRFLREHRPVYGLETATEQLMIFDLIPMRLQISMLRETILQIDEIPQMLERMLRTYVAGDLDGLKLLSMAQQAGSDPELTDWFEEKLINQRNVRMVERLQKHLQAGASFIAVGALHLVGDKGLISLLQQQGYKVSIVQ